VEVNVMWIELRCIELRLVGLVGLVSGFKRPFVSDFTVTRL